MLEWITSKLKPSYLRARYGAQVKQSIDLATQDLSSRLGIEQPLCVDYEFALPMEVDAISYQDENISVNISGGHALAQAVVDREQKKGKIVYYQKPAHSTTSHELAHVLHFLYNASTAMYEVSQPEQLTLEGVADYFNKRFSLRVCTEAVAFAYQALVDPTHKPFPPAFGLDLYAQETEEKFKKRIEKSFGCMYDFEVTVEDVNTTFGEGTVDPIQMKAQLAYNIGRYFGEKIFFDFEAEPRVEGSNSPYSPQEECTKLGMLLHYPLLPKDTVNEKFKRLFFGDVADVVKEVIATGAKHTEVLMRMDVDQVKAAIQQ